MGFLTLKKQVLGISNEKRKTIGFIVLTYKRGGSVKTGPTVFIEDGRNRGYGQLMRSALENKLMVEGKRKVYCTSTVNNREVINYLLSSGYRVECQLRKHYGLLDELVFGKILKNQKVFNSTAHAQLLRKPQKSLAISEARVEDKSQAISFLTNEFSKDIVKIQSHVAENFLADSFRSLDLLSYEDKPKSLFLGRTGKGILLMCICLPKRGGALKAVLLSKSSVEADITSMVKSIERFAARQGRHKLYFTVPEQRQDIVECLRRGGFGLEGVLEAPYRPGVNIFMLSKLIKPIVSSRKID